MGASWETVPLQTTHLLRALSGGGLVSEFASAVPKGFPRRGSRRGSVGFETGGFTASLKACHLGPHGHMAVSETCGPFLRCHYHKSPTIWGSMLGPLIF